MNEIYGYIRVSTREQNADRQLVALKNFGIAEKNIFIDKQSGKDFNRPAYIELVQNLKPNDTLVVKSIDRLGRDFYEILGQWRIITTEKQASIVVLDMPLLDTRNQQSDLTSQLISTLVLQLLSYVAQIERDFIHQRQAEGIAAAKAKGIRFGRPIKDKPDNYDEVFNVWQQGKISAREAGRRLHVDYKTFREWAKIINDFENELTTLQIIAF